MGDTFWLSLDVFSKFSSFLMIFNVLINILLLMNFGHSFQPLFVSNSLNPPIFLFLHSGAREPPMQYVRILHSLKNNFCLGMASPPRLMHTALTAWLSSTITQCVSWDWQENMPQLEYCKNPSLSLLVSRMSSVPVGVQLFSLWSINLKMNNIWALWRIVSLLSVSTLGSVTLTF